RLMSPLKAVLPHQQGVLAGAFSQDGQTVFTVTRDEVRLWEAETGKLIRGPFALQGQVLAAAFSPDRKTLLTGCADKTARLWEIASGQQIGLPLQHRDKVQAVTF